MNNLVIGITGFARCGKDTLTKNILNFLESGGISGKQYSFANYLKQDLRELCLSKFNIDSFTENTEQKTLIRPLLISYGEVARNSSKGTYWWKQVKTQIDKDFSEEKVSVAIVSDCRFFEYEGQDEVDFIKSYKNNLIVTVEQEGCKPAHISEAINIPKIKNISDVVITWPHFGEENLNDSSKYCENLFSKILNRLING